jgi:thymidine kinase
MVGYLNVITGPMMAGKTVEVFRRMSIDIELGLKVLYINHSCDDRGDKFSTHNICINMDNMEDKCTFLKDSDLPEWETLKPYDSIYIDEFQFFTNKNIVPKILFLVDIHKKYVTVSGLSSDSNREKWGYLLDLQPLADNFLILKGKCLLCPTGKNKDAIFSLKIGGEKNKLVEPGGKEIYTTVCRKCYTNNELSK